MGGGTSLVEAKALGRHSVGSDVSSLAVFLAKTKTTILSDDDRAGLDSWADAVLIEALSLRNPVLREKNWVRSAYMRNLSDRSTWAIRKVVELALTQLDRLCNDRQRKFARCAILRTGQWALDCRTYVPSASQFRSQLLLFLREMILGSEQFGRACERNGAIAVARCLHQSAVSIDATYRQTGLRAPSLVVTSPPYPGVHVVYHRWQVFGRRETPAAFWIAGTKDGAGASFYTFGDRHQDGLTNYFDTARDAFRAVAKISNNDTTIVQMVAFSERDWQLPRYLQVMNDAGFEELRGSAQGAANRTWRSVPNRKWYASAKGVTGSSREVVLFHRLTR
jgi:hypothetical protein